MIFNLKFIVDGSIDTFLEKKLSSGPGARIKKVFFVESKKKRKSKEFFGGIRLPNNFSVKTGIGFNT